MAHRAQVHKVRFVASTLLDAVRKAETAPASAARAHAYLCECPTNSLLRVIDMTLTSRACASPRGLPVHLVRDRKELSVGVVSHRLSPELCTLTGRPPICRLDDDRDGASSADGLPMVGAAN